MTDPGQTALEEMLRWANDHTDDWPFEDIFGGMLRATFARATKTFAAGARLTREGYGPQAMMLARSLTEDMVVAYWSVWVKDPEWVVERLVDHANSFRLIGIERVRAYPHLFGSVELHGEIELRDEEERYKVLFGRYGSASWWANDIEEVAEPGPGQSRYKVVCTRNLPLLLDELEEAAREKTGTDESFLTVEALLPLVEGMRPMFDFLHRSGNSILHHTGFIVMGTFNQEEENWQEGPSEDWLAEARGTLYMAFQNLVFLMCDRFNMSLVDSYVAVNPKGLGAFVKDDS